MMKLFDETDLKYFNNGQLNLYYHDLLSKKISDYHNIVDMLSKNDCKIKSYMKGFSFSNSNNRYLEIEVSYKRSTSKITVDSMIARKNNNYIIEKCLELFKLLDYDLLSFWDVYKTASTVLIIIHAFIYDSYSSEESYKIKHVVKLIDFVDMMTSDFNSKNISETSYMKSIKEENRSESISSIVMYMVNLLGTSETTHIK